MKNLTRAALLINSQAPGSNYLRGVSADSRRMQSFLKSPLGGCFYDNEITILQNPTCDQVRSTLQRLNVDYLLLHVASHGFSQANGKQMICLQDGNLADFALFNQSRMQTVLIDACANIPKSGVRIGSIDDYEEQADYFDGSWARQTFSNCIAAARPGKIIIRGAKFGQYAFEEAKRIGGQFTFALLDSMQQLQLKGQEGIVPVQLILEQADQLLQNKPD